MKDGVELKKWLNPDKAAPTMHKQWFMGTMIASMGDLKGYIVQILFPNLAIPTRVYQTHEETLKIENEIWEAFAE